MENPPPSFETLPRYARQIAHTGVGQAGQQNLAKARILIVGMGGLGCSAAQYLSAAGVGTLGLIDPDVVEPNNLHRQILYTPSDVGHLKVHVAAKRLATLNPSTVLQTFPTRLSTDNAMRIVSHFDVVINSTDDFSATYLINDVCVLQRKPMVHAAIEQLKAQVAVFDPRRSDSNIAVDYRDLFSAPPPAELASTGTETGVIGALPGLIGSMQALEAIKLLCNLPSKLIDHLLCLDCLTFTTQLIAIKPKATNPLRVSDSKLHEVTLAEHRCLCTAAASDDELQPETLLDWIRSGQPFQLLDVRTAEESKKLFYGGLRAPVDTLYQTPFQPHANTPIVLYCKSGARSQRGIYILRQRFPESTFLSLARGTSGLLLKGVRPNELQPHFDACGRLRIPARSIHYIQS